MDVASTGNKGVERVREREEGLMAFQIHNAQAWCQDRLTKHGVTAQELEQSG